jgi:hypothetical protein
MPRNRTKCIHRHDGGKQTVCLSLERVRINSGGSSIFPKPEKCGKGKCIFFTVHCGKRQQFGERPDNFEWSK